MKKDIKEEYKNMPKEELKAKVREAWKEVNKVIKINADGKPDFDKLSEAERKWFELDIAYTTLYEEEY